MRDQALIETITRKVLEQIGGDQPCSGCALRVCDAGERACDAAISQSKIPVGVSARHAHVSQEHLDILYGRGHQLTTLAPLYQPGAFAAQETLTVVGRRMRSIEGVRILGPSRDYTQVELARTDAIRLGLDPPIRDSGDLAGSEPISLIGPAGSLYLNEGAILATRHIHMTPQVAKSFGVEDGDSLKVRIPGNRALTLENIRPKISPSYVLQMHLDTDDSNAAGLRGGEAVELLRD
ncbi:MAG: phosphate propanoyltransferase [Candidatus Poribacteria bacterium]|nr:phosphate propanoyltransferase [Candidatus Poribacteria bacterium]MDE0504821.1 phosphate propanoyltransferase [Candidatus Poribacteria bacterium]